MSTQSTERSRSTSGRPPTSSQSTESHEPRLSAGSNDRDRPEEISIEIPLDGCPDSSESEIPPEEFERASRALVRLSPENRTPLPLGIRIAIFVVGWLLILIGIAGLVLPGIQGVFTIVAGAALISLDNELVYRGLRRVFQRWPRIWERIERFREKSNTWIQRRIHKNKPKA